jgi:hypothetical protein
MRFGVAFLVIETITEESMVIMEMERSVGVKSYVMKTQQGGGPKIIIAAVHRDSCLHGAKPAKRLAFQEVRHFVW